MTKQELLQKADSLPLSPGVYIMMDKTGLVIYVGKAKKLKNRVSQYFQSGSGHNEKTRMMVSQVDHFDTIVVRTEFEALILENSLIKRHQPRYNILLKDDKGYPFVRLNEKAPYPRFTLVNKPEEDGARYFGPFGGRHETRAALQAVCAALKLPTCNRQFPRDIGKERPCLNHHIGKCDGFCSPDGPGQAEYHSRMTQAAELLGGKLRQVTANLRQEMETAAEALEFEKAAALRDRMQALQVLGKQQQVIAGVCADTDVWGVYIGPVRCGAAVLHIENGDLLGRQIEIFPTAADQAESEVLSAVLSQYYLDKAVLPREILLPCLFDGSETFAALLTALDEIPGDYLIRFMSSQPKDASFKLFDTMARCSHVAKQLHLPVQSGSDRVLRAMNRPYDKARYLELITYARKVMPELVLTSDVIIGFPGETEAEAMETVALVEQVRFDALFTFIFSPRPGTPAAKMDDPVPRAEKQVWFDRLCDAQNKISEEIHAQYVGRTLRCLIDGQSDDSRWPLTARTAGGRLVHLVGDASAIGNYHDVKITDSNTWALFGEMV